MKDNNQMPHTSDPMFNEEPSPAPIKKDFKMLCIVLVGFAIVAAGLSALGVLK